MRLERLGGNHEHAARELWDGDLPTPLQSAKVCVAQPGVYGEEGHPCHVIGQAPNVNGASWGGYAGWEEFNGIIRGIQIYSGLLSVADIQSEIANPMSTTAGQSLIWYLNVNPRPSDVTDKSGRGHNPSWDGTPAPEWME